MSACEHPRLVSRAQLPVYARQEFNLPSAFRRAALLGVLVVVSCLISPAGAAAGAGMLDLKYEQTVGGFTAPPEQQVVRSSSRCGRDFPNTSLLGGGSYFKGSRWGEVRTSSSAPYDPKRRHSLRSWQVAADNLSKRSAITFGEAEICGKIPKVHYVREGFRVPRRGYAPVIAFCPGRSHAIGGGGYTSAPLGAMRLVESYPYRQSGSGNPNAWRVWFENKSNEGHRAVAYAICSRVRGLRYRSTKVHVPAKSRGRATAKCPRGTYVMGGGIFAPKIVGEAAVVQSTFAGTAPGYDAWRGTIDNLSDHGGALTTFAVCHH